MPTLTNKEARLSFIVEYNDTQAGLIRKYQLCYYTLDDTIEMYDIKNRRIFLKRCSIPQITPRELHLGATVTVYSRKLHVVGYADDATKQVYAGESESGVIAVPGSSFDLLGRVLAEVTSAGLRIKNINTLQLSRSEAAEFVDRAGMKGGEAEWAGQTVAVIETLGNDASGVWAQVEAAKNFGTWGSTPDNAVHFAEWFFGTGSARRDRSSATMRDCTVGIVKPHAVDKFGGAIVEDILAEGFQLTALKMVNMDTRDAGDFLEVYKGVVPEYRAMTEQLSSGTAWVMEVKGENPVASFRELCGPHDPDIAKVLRPNSLRAKYGTSRVQNAIHCTDLPEDGELESDFFFNIMRPTSS